MQEWWNWQTHQLEGLADFGLCGFKSRLLHHCYPPPQRAMGLPVGECEVGIRRSMWRRPGLLGAPQETHLHINAKGTRPYESRNFSLNAFLYEIPTRSWHKTAININIYTSNIVCFL